MKKYIGILVAEKESMIGLHLDVLCKFYDDKETFKEWFSMYPKSRHVILENTKEMESMFDLFEDMTPVTEEEKQEMKEAEKIYNKHMKYLF